MNGLMDFCYAPVLPSPTHPTNSSFSIWQDGDFTPCFEYLVFIISLHVLFSLTSALYAGLKHTVITRRRKPLALMARALVSLCVVVNSLIEFVAAFWIVKARPYAILLAEVVVVVSWCVHLWCVMVLGSSIKHSGRGPIMLNSMWFVTVAGTAVHLRTIIRWNTNPDAYRYLTDDYGTAYFTLLLQVTTYVHLGLQCLYAVTLLFRVKPVAGHNIKLPRNFSRLLESGSTQYSEEDEDESVRRRLISSEWKPDSSAQYGSIQIPGENLSKLEASEDGSNLLSLLTFWWVQPLMKRGAVGLLQRPEDLLQLPESLRTARVREQFQNSLDRYRHHLGRTYEGNKTDDRGHQAGATPTQVTTSENALDVDVNMESGSEDVSMAMPFSDEATLLTSFTRSVKKGKQSDHRTDPGGEPKTSRHREHDHTPSQDSGMSLVWGLNRAFGCHFYPLGLLKLAADILGFAGPLLLHALVAFMENRTEPIANGYYYALGLFLTTFFMALLNTHFTYQVNKVGLKIRAALITEIYRKALHVNYTSLSEFSTGQVVNYMSTDTDRIVNFCQSFHQFWSLPFQIAVSLYLLYQQVGLAFLTGVGFCILLVPINRWLAVKIGKLSTEMMASKDSRVKMMSEILTGIRVIKFYAWEKNFTKKVLGIRSSELKSLKGRKYLDALCVYFWATTPVLISILTFTTYVLMGYKLTAAKVFTSVALFNILISPLNAFPWVLNGLVEAWVSIKRVREFLRLSELDLSQYYITQSQERSVARPQMQEEDTGVYDDAAIFIKEGCFTWTREDTTDDERGQTSRTSLTSEATGAEGDTKESTPPPIEWTLTDVNLVVKPGQLVGVVGKVGTGKSSLLAAITAEMRRKGGEICVANLEDGFGLAAQEAWIQHATVRENILFGKPFNSEKYSAIIYACALEQDLQVLPAGDCTEVGENGVTLSGGQKARLALARAVYQDKEVYLLDDPLAAVDAHVATHLFTHCITGLLRHKTRILCTHHIRYLHEADIVLVMEGGRITSCGPPTEVLPLVEERLLGEGGSGGREEGAAENTEQMRADQGLEQTLPPPTASETQPRQEVEHVLVKEEEKEVGVVAFGVYRAYWSAVGNILAPTILLSLFLMQASRNINDWWLAYWISHTNSGSTAGTNISAYNITPSDMEWRPRINMEWNRDPWTTNTSIHSLPLYSASDNLVFYLGIYGGLAAANSVFTLLRAFLYAYGGVRAATVLHRRLLQSILRAPVSFFDVTPIGRIVNRFSSDLYAIDDSLPFILNILLAQFYGLLGTIAITCYGLPWFTLLLVPLGVLYYHIQKFYRRTSRELKRLSTVTLSPVYAHFSESLVGLCTIRALRASERFIGENEARVEVNQRANFGSYAVAQWLGIRLQMLGVAMVTGVSFIAVLEHHFNSVDPGLVGLAISYALSVTNLLSGVVTSFTETEKQMVSVERAIQYIQGAPQEQNHGTNEPTHNWPSQGVVEFKKAVLVYREDLPPALKEVSFVTRPVEKIGVVGRTGSGKSSLFQALFRMVELSGGSILLDGVDIISLSLEQLRSVLAVIPQDPFLFSGSVRENLDPCQKHSDHELASVLERCHLRVAVRDLGGLGAEVQEKGRVFSVGQRQLLCLARALLTQAKVICIDEATANVDLHTDSQIQQTIRSEFTDSTVITVAHRIDTVLNSDRILVMEQGQIKEFGSPAQLLDNPDSLFSALFREHCK